MRIYIGTCITKDYIKKAFPFLYSLNKFHQDSFCVCYGFSPDLIDKDFPGIRFYYLPRNQIEISGMIQWGTWLKVVPYKNEDIFIISDSDMLIQRPLQEQEIAHFSKYDEETVGGNMNVENDRLEIEAQRISLNKGYQYAKAAKVINCGVLVGRPLLFKTLTEEMEKRIPDFDRHCSHRSRCQFLICHIFSILKTKIDILHKDFHSHGHFGLPNGCAFVNPAPTTYPVQRVVCGGKTVMFKHHFEKIHYVKTT